MERENAGSSLQSPMEQIVRRHFKARFPEVEVKESDKLDRRIKLLAKSIEDNLIAQIEMFVMS